MPLPAGPSSPGPGAPATEAFAPVQRDLIDDAPPSEYAPLIGDTALPTPAPLADHDAPEAAGDRPELVHHHPAPVETTTGLVGERPLLGASAPPDRPAAAPAVQRTTVPMPGPERSPAATTTGSRSLPTWSATPSPIGPGFGNVGPVVGASVPTIVEAAEPAGPPPSVQRLVAAMAAAEERADASGQAPDSAPPAEADAVAAPSPAAPEGAAAQVTATPAAAVGSAPTDVDALVRRLYDPLVRRLKAELRLDRERAGNVLDLRH